MPKMGLVAFVCGLSLLWIACSVEASAPSIPSAPDVDLALPSRGVPDRGVDPAVVVLALYDKPWCTGTLLESDLVLTARRCVEIVEGQETCPTASGPLEPTDLVVEIGDAVASATPRARARAVQLPSGDQLCGSDIALLSLDSPIDDVQPVVVRATGAAAGDHVRTVSFTPAGKIVRDHVPITETSPREFALSEVPCIGLPGGAVIDDTTGDLVGVVSRGDPLCSVTSGWEVATRADAFFELIQQSLAAGHASRSSHQAKGKKGAVDQGADCERATQCAAGACVSYVGAKYCTRTCSPTDPCPTHTRCMTSRQSTPVCVAE